MSRTRGFRHDPKTGTCVSFMHDSVRNGPTIARRGDAEWIDDELSQADMRITMRMLMIGQVISGWRRRENNDR